jgi:Histidine kinase-like ATPase domain
VRAERRELRAHDRIEPRVAAAQEARLAGSAASHWLPPPAVEMAALVSDELALGPDCDMRWACFPGAGTPTPGGQASRVRRARDFTASTLRQWGVAGRCDDVAIVVSELVTNALQHARPASSNPGAGSPIQLGLLHPGHCVMCAVADASKAVPVPRDPDFLDESGRGLHVIAALSDQWGYTTSVDTGKVIWALFAT